MQTNNENVIPRAYYFSDAKTFISTSEEVIYHALVHNSLQFDLTAQQETAWTEEIRILKTVMRGLSDDDYIAMEYTIPRMGKRIDSVIFCNNHVFLVEFKVFETSYSKHASDQVLDYALDLHNFHELSHEIALFPILVCTNAHDAANHITIRDGVAPVTYCNAESLLSEVHALVQAFPISASINAKCWINAPYKPTPTIIEAAQALYSGHAVREISHKESDENDIEVTTKCINDIIEESKSNGRKSICFVTGVPGAGKTLVSELLSNVDVKTCRELHLSVSMRSFRSELVSAFAKAVIDGERQYASELYKAISQVEPATGSVRYPVVLTRNLESAKAWVKSISRGTERYGIIASSGAKRLRADGITVSKDIDVVKWFLNDSSDVDSSFFMEVAASEFKIQGLEIDYAVMAWEGDYRYSDGDGLFTCNKFEGSAWKTIRSAIEKKYLKNSYRVLLTRARQGFVIYVPQGCENDPTRLPQYYDGTFDYLKSIGIKEI